jgi:hypothetical protein
MAALPYCTQGNRDHHAGGTIGAYLEDELLDPGCQGTLGRRGLVELRLLGLRVARLAEQPAKADEHGWRLVTCRCRFRCRFLGGGRVEAT